MKTFEMRVFIHRSFLHFAQGEDMDDAALWKAAGHFCPSKDFNLVSQNQ